MIERIRPAYTEEQLAEVYPQQYDHTRWPDHLVRIAETIEFAATELPTRLATIGDMSCGDGVIPLGIKERSKLDARVYLGDFVEAPHTQFVGVIEDTIQQMPTVDLYVCSETLEHLDDPLSVLRTIRQKSDMLVLSTPCSETIPNPEHYWRWDVEGIASLLSQADFVPQAFKLLEFPELDVRYQLWACK